MGHTPRKVFTGWLPKQEIGKCKRKEKIINSKMKITRACYWAR